MADCVQWLQLYFLPKEIFLETNRFNAYLPWLCLKSLWKSHTVTWCIYFSTIFYNKDISYRLDLIRALPLRMADRAQQVQLNFLPHKISLETNEYNQYLP